MEASGGSFIGRQIIGVEVGPVFAYRTGLVSNVFPLNSPSLHELLDSPWDAVLNVIQNQMGSLGL